MIWVAWQCGYTGLQCIWRLAAGQQGCQLAIVRNRVFPKAMLALTEADLNAPLGNSGSHHAQIQNLSPTLVDPIATSPTTVGATT